MSDFDVWNIFRRIGLFAPRRLSRETSEALHILPVPTVLPEGLSDQAFDEDFWFCEPEEGLSHDEEALWGKINEHNTDCEKAPQDCGTQDAAGGSKEADGQLRADAGKQGQKEKEIDWASYFDLYLNSQEK